MKRLGEYAAIQLLILFLLYDPFLAFGHEPVFSIGPETIFRGGFGFESEFSFAKRASNRESGLHYEFIYGIRENFSISGEIPYLLNKKESGESSSGIGDVTLRGKYRFFKKDKLGAQFKISIIGGAKFPSGDSRKNPSTGTGSTDFFTGISAGYESRKWYYFATTRYRFNNKHGQKEQGDAFLYDFAFGLRPVRRSYYESDLVFLIEFNGEYKKKSRISGVADLNSGGNIMYLGPTFLWSLRNVMVKGGIQVPIVQNLNGIQTKEDFRSALSLEYHF